MTLWSAVRSMDKLYFLDGVQGQQENNLIVTISPRTDIQILADCVLLGSFVLQDALTGNTVLKLIRKSLSSTADVD